MSADPAFRSCALGAFGARCLGSHTGTAVSRAAGRSDLCTSAACPRLYTSSAALKWGRECTRKLQTDQEQAAHQDGEANAQIPSLPIRKPARSVVFWALGNRLHLRQQPLKIPAALGGLLSVR